jgi:hypothetical protein
MGIIKDITGQRFGRLTVLEAKHKRGASGRTRIYWLCQCTCGTKTIVEGDSLRSGNTKSCGCWRRESVGRIATKHGLSDHELYRTWGLMINRCENQNDPNFQYYGAQGVKVCERWRHSFPNFLADMGERPPEMTLDRYPDKNGNYEPNNCRWATRKQQIDNRRPSTPRRPGLTGIEELPSWSSKGKMRYGKMRYQVKFKECHIGVFPTLDMARTVRKTAERFSAAIEIGEARFSHGG